MPQRSNRGARAKSCNVQNGLPVVDGKDCGYYICREDGRRMLIMERRSGERLRIHGEMELVVLEIHPGKVKFAIECPADDHNCRQLADEVAFRSAKGDSH